MTRTLLTLTAALALATPAAAQDMFIDNATIVTATDVRPDTDIEIRNGRIARIGANLRASEEVPVQMGGFVTPGLFAPYSTLGLVEIGGEASTNDIGSEAEGSSVSELAADSFNPYSVHIANARMRGVTHAVVAPSPDGDSIFAGTGIIIDLSGDFGSVIDEAAFVHVAIGQRGAGLAGGSRAAAMAQLRGALRDATRTYDDPDDGDVLSRADAAALRPAVNGRIPLMVSVSRASDMMRLIALKDEFPRLDMILVGAEEAHLIAGELASADMKVIVDPQENLPASFDSVNASFDNVLILQAAGVDYAIANLGALGVSKAGTLNQHAGNAVGNGLSRQAAFAAITDTPARWFGLPTNSLEVGDAASLVVWDGDPFEVTSAPVAIMIDGENVGTDSRMRRLRDRYNPLSNSTQPHKYR